MKVKALSQAESLTEKHHLEPSTHPVTGVWVHYGRCWESLIKSSVPCLYTAGAPSLPLCSLLVSWKAVLPVAVWLRTLHHNSRHSVSVWEGIEEIQYTEACPESSPSSALAFLKFPLFTNQLMRKSWVNCLIMKWLTHFYNKLSFQSLHWLIMWNQWKSASESPDLWFIVNLLRNLLKNDLFFYVWSCIHLGDYMYTTSMQRPAKARGHQIP